MDTIDAPARLMQSVLSSCADQAALTTGFVRRRSKLTGSLFVQTLVLGWLSNPDATLEELAQTAAARGVRISPQGLDQRFTMAAAETIRMALEAATTELVTGGRADLPLLNRFKGVYIADSSIVILPDELRDLWPGIGCTPESASALKFQVMLDLSSGRLTGPIPGSARVNDKTAACQAASLPRGALRIADLGYFVLSNLAEVNDQGVYWLSRMSMNIQIIDEGTRKEIDLPAFLARQASGEIDTYVLAGKVERMRCRLLGVRVPPQVAAERRRKMLANGRDRCRPVKARRLLLADWNLLLTNVPSDMLSLPEAQALYRARWQIEMLFKLWKSYGKIARWRSHKPMRILCEVYAKLLAMLVQHWILIASCWSYPDRSLAKAASTIRRSAMELARALDDAGRLRSALRFIRDCLALGCRMNKRRKDPATNQLLVSPGIIPPATAMVA